MHELFTPDGVYDLNGSAIEGQTAIREGYAARASGAERTSIHVTTDVRVHPSERGFTATSVMQVFAADGPPPLTGTAPLVVAAVTDHIAASDDKELLFERRSLSYVFISGGALSTPVPTRQSD